MTMPDPGNSYVHQDADDRNVEHSAMPKMASKRVLGSLLASVLLINLSMSLYQLPLNRAVERRLCREYYAAEDPAVFDPAGEIREELCKVDAVQRELAWIQGAMETAWIVGDFVVTIPLGFVAEKYGRRRVLWLNLVPRVCMLAWAVTVGYFDDILPTKAILAAPMLSVLGGDCVFNSIVYALASDMTNDRTLRATYFAYLGSTSYVVALLGPALASATMTIHLWLPFYIGIALLLACIWTITALHSHDPSLPDTYESSPLLSSPLLKAQDHPSLTTSISHRFTAMGSILTTHPRNFTLLLASFFLTSLASSDTKLLVQYVSKRYAWTFASAGYLLSGKAGVNFVLLTIVIPRVVLASSRNTQAQQHHNTHDGTYLTYAKICIAISVLGAVLIALASTIPLLVPALLLYALGSALPVFTMSLLKSPLVSPADGDGLALLEGGKGETQVFGVVMLTKTLGSLVGAPLMAGVWMRGIAVGGAALGLPYFVSAGCYVLSLGVVSGMRVS